MPKRVIDGDSLWVSEKLTTVPEKYRAEYAWILPLAQANGCFECSPMLVWRTCYSALRPEWTTANVAAMLDEFVAAKMLFRFQKDGKTYGFFVGIQKEGRLPKPSDRVKSAKQWQNGMVPAKELAVFLGLTGKKIEEDYRDEVAPNSRVTRGKAADKSPTGIGVGVGVGSGTGGGEGNGVGKGTGHGIGGGTEAASLPTPLYNTAPLNTSLPQHDNTQNDNTTTPNTQHSGASDSIEFPDECNSSVIQTPIRDDFFHGFTARGYAQLFRLLMYENPHSTDIPKGWCDMWEKDFQKLLGMMPHQGVLSLIAMSQVEKNQQFYIRPIKLIENRELLKDMINERKEKAFPIIWKKFVATVKRLDVEKGWPHG